MINPIEHSENKIITQSGLFGNEIGPGVLQSSVQQTRVLQEYQRHKPCATDYVSFCPYFMNYLQIVCLLHARLEHSMSDLVFGTCTNFILGMLYSTFGKSVQRVLQNAHADGL